MKTMETEHLTGARISLEGLPENAAVEIAVVRCEPGHGARYNEQRARMLVYLQKQPGFIAWRGFESTTQPGVMLDVLYWEKPEDCRRAGEHMQNVPEAAEFFSMMKETVVFDTFRRQM